jgi:hypothetical protein
LTSPADQFNQRTIAEYPLTEPKPMPLFSEAFFVRGLRRRPGHGFLAYLNAAPFGFSLTREILAFFLPDGRVLLAKAFGRGRAAITPQGGANLFFECIKPFEHWQLWYNAPALVTTQQQTLLGPVPDGI